MTARNVRRRRKRERGQDAVARTLRTQVQALLTSRPDLSRANFGAAIHRNGPWYSEFFSGKRKPDSLRLVLEIAAFFGVSVSFLVGEPQPGREDAQTVSLLGIWGALEEAHREDVLHFARRLRLRQTQRRPPRAPTRRDRPPATT